MKSFVLISILCIYSITFATSKFHNLGSEITIRGELEKEKELTATFDGFDGETYNFIGVDIYGEEFFFIVNAVEASVLTEFNLKTDTFKNTKFKIHYKEEASGDTGNTKITITKLIKI